MAFSDLKGTCIYVSELETEAFHVPSALGYLAWLMVLADLILCVMWKTLSLTDFHI